MKFALGYQLAGDGETFFSDAVREFREHIAEIYFPWMDTATCRASITEQRGFVNWNAQNILESDLSAYKDMGIKLDILFNANCYGEEALSLKLANRIVSIFEHLRNSVGGVEIATTTSPAIAHIIKDRFPDVEVRASVNMRIGTVKGMQYLSDLFDSFHVQREYNRDLKKIAELRDWADKNGKKLVMLANSGCMSFCSGQTFHDNLVAHENHLDDFHNIKWNPHVCWKYLEKKENWVSLLQNTWIRPEDIGNYEKYFDVVKLATRMHSRPWIVIKAYVERKYNGNILDICEPGFGPAIAPCVIDNSKFPEDWFQRTTACSGNCESCTYCTSVLEKVLVDLNTGKPWKTAVSQDAGNAGKRKNRK